MSALQYFCTSVLLYYCTTIPLYFCTTLLLYYNITVLLLVYYSTAVQYYKYRMGVALTDYSSTVKYYEYREGVALTDFCASQRSRQLFQVLLNLAKGNDTNKWFVCFCLFVLFLMVFKLLCTLPGRRPGIAKGNEQTRLGRVHLYFFSLLY